MSESEVSLAEIAQGGLFVDGDWVETKDQDPGGSVRLTQLADVGIGVFRDRSNRWMREDQAERLNCTLLQESDVLIARMPDPIGRACVMPANLGRAVTAVDVAILRVRADAALPRYVMWMINSPPFRARVEGQQSGTTRKRISRKNLAELKIPLPAPVEQQRVVDVIEDHLSHLDAAEANLLQSRRLLGALRGQTMERALTGVDGQVGQAEAVLADAGARDGRLAPLPVGWRWVRLAEVAEVVGGVTKDAAKQSDPAYVAVPYLRVANVKRGALQLESVTTIKVAPAKAAALTLQVGDVLMNEGGDRDKLARGWVWEGQIDNCIHQNHVFRARLRDDALDPYFLSWTANTFGGRWAEANAKQSVNLASISLSTIRKMPVIVPPPGLAREVVARLRDSLASVDRLVASLDDALIRSRQLRRALLSAAFNGQLLEKIAGPSAIEQARVSD